VVVELELLGMIQKKLENLRKLQAPAETVLGTMAVATTRALKSKMELVVVRSAYAAMLRLEVDRRSLQLPCYLVD